MRKRRGFLHLVRKYFMITKSEQFRIIAQIAFIWLVSDLGYYLVLPRLGVTPQYNESGMAIALYYFYWIGLSVVLFWPVYVTWQEQSRWNTFDNRLISATVWTAFFFGAVLFVGFVMPALPPFAAPEGTTPPELPFANRWYFLPKSVDILFQQLLVAALVLSLAAQKTKMRRIALICAALFGGSHVLLLFGGAPLGYVVRFSVMAFIFGLIFPYLMLRVRNGLAYSYITHWSFYAIVIVIARSDF
jgi:hypothetical protein